LISHQNGPTTTWALTHALIGGAQPISGWWAPSHCTIKRRWGPAAHRLRFTCSRVSPLSKTLVRSEEGAQQVTGSHHRLQSCHCTVSPYFTVPLLFTNHRCPCADLHRRTQWWPPAPPRMTVDLLPSPFFSFSNLSSRFCTRTIYIVYHELVPVWIYC
jgi:hypothetical protein